MSENRESRRTYIEYPTDSARKDRRHVRLATLPEEVALFWIATCPDADRHRRHFSMGHLMNKGAVVVTEEGVIPDLWIYRHDDFYFLTTPIHWSR